MQKIKMEYLKEKIEDDLMKTMWFSTQNHQSVSSIKWRVEIKIKLNDIIGNEENFIRYFIRSMPTINLEM
jgi:hypothetical protein